MERLTDPTPDQASDRPSGLPASLERVLSSRWWLPVCALLGVALRLGLLAKVGAAMTFADEWDYDRIAQALASGQGFSNYGLPTAFRPPGEPFYLAAIYALVGHRVVLAEALQALLLAAVPFAVARFARRHGLALAWANVAGGLASFHPGLAYSSATLYPAILTATGISVGLMYAAEAIAAPRGWRDAALAGLFLGIAGAATTTFVPLTALAAVIVFRARKTDRLVTAALLLAVGFAPAAAWMVRNKVTMGEAVLATHGSFNLALGANDEATPRSGNWIAVPLPADVGSDELERAHAYRDLAVGWIRAHPARYALLVAGRGLATFDSVGRPKTRGVHDSLAARAVGYAMFPWILLALVGLAIDRRRPTTHLVAAALACVILGGALMIAKPRFRFPCDPMLAVLTVAALRSGLALLAARRASRAVAAALPPGA